MATPQWTLMKFKHFPQFLQCCVQNLPRLCHIPEYTLYFSNAVQVSCWTNCGSCKNDEVNHHKLALSSTISRSFVSRKAMLLKAVKVEAYIVKAGALLFLKRIHAKTLQREHRLFHWERIKTSRLQNTWLNIKLAQGISCEHCLWGWHSSWSSSRAPPASVHSTHHVFQVFNCHV